MADYNLVYTAFWLETQGWSDDERVCALYLLTCAHRRSEGLYLLPSAYAAHDTGWTAGRFDGAVSGLVGRGWALREGDWIMLVNGLRWNVPKGNQVKGARNAVAMVPRDSAVYARFHAQAEAHAPALAELLDRPSEAHREPLASPSGPNPSGAPSKPLPSIGSIDGTPFESSVHTQAPSLPPLDAADAPPREGVGAHEAEPDAAALWTPVNEQLRQVPEWADALDRGASVACLALVQANRDVPWAQIAGTAAASRLDPDAGFTTDSPRQALGMQLEDHRSGRSTGAGERGRPPRRQQRSSLDHYRDMAAEFAAEESGVAS